MRRAALSLLVFTALLHSSAAAPGTTDVPGDPTPPVVTPIIVGTLGLQGWYVTNVTLSWSIVDPESIILETNGCDTTTFTSDTVGSTRTCSATSDGGTTTVSKRSSSTRLHPRLGEPRRRADSNGWYNHALTVGFSGSDATSGLDSCDAPKSYAGPDTADATVAGSCRDKAGNSKSTSLVLNYDATVPQASAAPARGPDANGWYNHPLSVSFDGSDVTSGIESCSGPQTYSGPDGGGSITGSCRDRAGNVAGRSLGVAYDATAPLVTPSPARSADVNGWYNHPLTVTFAGSDAMSGIATCSSVPYAGPDDSSAVVSGTCRDRAGNAAAAPFSFRYDATGPVVSGVRAKPGNRSTELTWDVSTDKRMVEITRVPGVRGAATTVVYRGSGERYREAGLQVGRRYRYTVAAYDEAANRGLRTITVVGTGPLLDPAPGERVSSPPRLVWAPVKGTTYYNVQLIRDRQLLSAWPTRPNLQLRRTWVSNGRRYRLKPGIYRWYVWPGLGRPSEGRYGARIGGSSFVVIK